MRVDFKKGYTTNHLLIGYSMVALFFVIRLPNAFTNLNDAYQFRQTQTAWGIREVANHGLNFLNLKMPVLGPPYKVPFEFPLFQNISGLVAHFFNLNPAFSGRLVALVFYVADIVLMIQLSRFVVRREVFVIFLPLLLFTPYAFEWSDACLIESCALFFLLASLNFYRIFLEKKRMPLMVVCILSLILAMLVKITTAVPLAPALLFFILFRKKRKINSRYGLLLLVSIVISYIPTLVWTRYADHVKAESALSAWLTSQRLLYWNFGTFGSRFNLHNLQAVVGRIWLIGGFLVVVGVSVAIREREHLTSKLILCGLAVSPICIYFNLYVVHDYYYLAIFPFVILAISYLFDVHENLERHLITSFLSVVIPMLFVLWTVQFHSRNYLDILHMDRNSTINGVAELRQISNVKDKILVVGCDWDPSFLYQVDRYGIAAPNWTGGVESTIDFLVREKLMKDLNYLVICNSQKVPTSRAGVHLLRVSNNVYRISVAN